MACGSSRCAWISAADWRLSSSSAAAGNAGVRSSCAEQGDRVVHRVAMRQHRDLHLVAARRDRKLRLQRVEPILDLHARQAGAALVDHRRGELRHFAQARQAALVAQPQRHRDAHGLPARGLGQQRHLHAVGQCQALRLGIDVGRRRVERRHRGRRRLRLEGLHLRRHVHLLGSAARAADARWARRCAIVRFDGSSRCCATRCTASRVNACTRSRIKNSSRQSPCATVSDNPTPIVSGLLYCCSQPFSHLVCARLNSSSVTGSAAQPLDHLDQLLRAARRVLPSRELRTEQRNARLGHRQRLGIDRRCEARLDQPLVRAPRRAVADDQRDQLHRRIVGVRPRRRVIAEHHLRHAADAAQRDAALAVLHRVDRVQARQRALGLRDAAERLLDPAHHARRIELARDDQRRVVGLVVQAIERLQPADVDVLDVAARADRRLAVVVPLEHRGQRLLEQDAPGVVLAHLHLVAHHRHLGVEILARDERVDHRVGLPAEVPAQVVVVGREAGEVVGAVDPGRAVGAQPALGELGPHRAVRRRALEDQVLQQVRHAGLAVVLVARADVIGHVDRGRGLAVIGGQQDLQAVGQPVLADALDLGHRFGRAAARTPACTTTEPATSALTMRMNTPAWSAAAAGLRPQCRQAAAAALR